jgi:EmrB/QacA subfamily drug resistance transporter
MAITANTSDSASTEYDRRWWILGVLCFSLLVIVLDNSILNVAIPTIIRDLQATNSQLQWIVDSYTIVFAGLLLTAGAMGDKFGRRRALQLGLLIFGFGSFLAAISSSATGLISTRALMGIGAAFIMPATLSIITNVFPPQERAKAIGIWAGVAGLGAALGPLTGGFLVEHFYWGSVFLVNLPIVVVGLIAGIVLIPESKDPSAPRLDPVGAVLSIAALSLLLFAIIEAPTHGWLDPKTVGIFVAGLILGVAFVTWERKIPEPMLDMSFFKNPRFSAANGAITVVFFAMFGSIFLLTQYFQFVLGYSPLETGLRMVPFALTLMVVAPTSSQVVNRFGTKRTVTAGLTLVASALVTMAFLEVDSGYEQIVWRLMLLAIGMGLTMAPSTDSVMGSLPLGKAGVGSAVNDTTRQVGGALGVAIIGSVLATVYGSKVSEFLSAQGAPTSAIDAAKGSLGGANLVAAQAPSSEQAARLLGVANSAFVDALHWSVIVAAIPVAIGAVCVYLFLPATARSEDLREQGIEFEAEHKN